MSNVTGTVRASLRAPTTPKVYNLSLPTANTEYSQPLDPNTVRFTVKIRNTDGLAARAQIAFTSGDTSVKWVTIPPGAVFSEEGLLLTGVTLYVQCNKPGRVAEIVQWT